MLKKLTTYEIKATSRFFLPLFAVFAGTSVILKIYFSLLPTNSQNVLAGLIGIIFVCCYALLAIGLFGMCYFICFYRFYKNIYSDEGYLTLTLPVTVDSHIVSKLITSILWILSSILLIIASVFLFFAGTHMFSEFMHEFSSIMHFIYTTYIESGGTTLLTVSGIISVMIQIVGVPLFIYMCITIGGLFPNHKLSASIAAFFIIQLGLSFFYTVFTYLLMTIFNVDIYGSPNAVFYAGTVIEIIKTIVCYFITRYLLKNKINL